MKRPLLIDSEVVHFLAGLKRRDREFLYARLELIRDYPANHADFRQSDEIGRTLDGHVAGRFGILFWDDHADQAVKIMQVVWADQREE